MIKKIFFALECIIFISFTLFLSACSNSKNIKILSIEVEQESLSESYKLDNFQLSDIKITINKSDKSSELISLTEDMIDNAYLELLSTAGTHTITVNYESFSTTFIITLVETKTHEVTFKDYNGDILDSQTIEHGLNATAPDDPVREGYEFIGWDKQFSNILSSIVVKAIYEPNDYEIVFISNGGTVIESMIVPFASPLPALPNPNKTDYNFEGWYVDDSLSIPFTELTMPLNGISLYAKWTLLEYEITNNKVTILSYPGNDTSITIPDKICGYPVTSIAENAFTHGFSQEEEKFFYLGIKEKSNSLIFTIENSGTLPKEASRYKIMSEIKNGTTHGLSMVYQKLQSVYFENFSIEIQKGQHGGFEVKLTLPSIKIR